MQRCAIPDRGRESSQNRESPLACAHNVSNEARCLLSTTAGATTNRCSQLAAAASRWCRFSRCASKSRGRLQTDFKFERFVRHADMPERECVCLWRVRPRDRLEVGGAAHVYPMDVSQVEDILAQDSMISARLELALGLPPEITTRHLTARLSVTGAT